MRVIIVADPFRKDFYDYLIEKLSDGNEIFLLWEYKHTGKEYPFQGKVKPLFWSSFQTPKKIIDDIEPDRIIFFEIIDFWQISLIICCHQFNIPSFFLEHGVGNSTEQVIRRFNEVPSIARRMKVYVNKLFYSLKPIIKGRIFFISSLAYLSSADRNKYLKLMAYFKSYTPLHALSLSKFRKRTPHFAVLFNKNNIAPFLLYNEIEDDCIYTGGVPFFDKYFWLSRLPGKDHVVFIEHPYLEEGILGWDDDFHEKIARNLEKFSSRTGKRVIVKLHPRSRIANWKRYNLRGKIEIVQHEDIAQELLSAEVILGYSSTLINVMIACRRNIVLLGWHPKPQIFGDDFSKNGLCHVSFEPEELQTKFSYWKNNNLAINNEKVYEDFLQEYSFPFDGKASSRIVDFIVNTSISK